jgi:sugar phosphate isomerase/epimerase
MQGRLPTIHLKDMTVKMWDPHITEVGNGNLEWPAILTAAQEAGAQWFVVEQDYSDRNPFDSLQISYEYLTQLGLT